MPRENSPSSPGACSASALHAQGLLLPCRGAAGGTLVSPWPARRSALQPRGMMHRSLALCSAGQPWGHPLSCHEGRLCSVVTPIYHTGSCRDVSLTAANFSPLKSSLVSD